MRRFRIRRRRALALALLPVAAITIGSTTSYAAQRQAAIDPAKTSVRFGDRVTLRGHFPGAPGASVAIQYKAASSRNFREVARTRTNENSRWTARVKPRGTGMWRARLASAPRAPQTDDPLAGQATVDPETGERRVAVRSVTEARATKHAIVGQSVRVRGHVAPGGKRKVVVSVGRRRVTTRTNGRGRFDVRVKAGSTGSYKVRARAQGNRKAAGSGDGAGKVTVYRRAQASWYGPGLYGNRTACGQTLAPGTLGVAHKSMPCGTKLTLRHGTNTVRVKVIDRGPYAGNREFDLTEATRNRLGFGDTGTVLTSK